MASESIKFDRAVDYYDQTRGFPLGVEADVATLITTVAGLGKSSRSLEIGVGTGRIALPMAAHVGAIVGIDLSRPMMTRLKAKQTGEAIHLAEGDASRLPFQSATFDAAVAVHVFHLIPNWRGALDEVTRVLKPGAPLISARNVDGMHAMWEEMRERGELPAQEHVGVQNEERETFLLDAGWRPVADAELVGWDEPFRPSNMINRIEQRLSSVTWRMSDEALADYVAALRRALSARFTDLDQDVVRPYSFSARAFLPPESK